nr:unnamed protein product [Callosobruchus analis]
MRISQIIQESKADSQVTEAIAKISGNSWEEADKNICFPFRLELSTFGPVRLLRGNRIIIPETLRNHTLGLSYAGHPGETVMKRRLRVKVWWPLTDRQVENFIKQCRDCLLVSQSNRQPPITRDKVPEDPWQCLAIDRLGSLLNQESVFVVIDYYSRYQDIKFLRTTTAAKIINHLNELFARFGIPKPIRSDNGRQFTLAMPSTLKDAPEPGEPGEEEGSDPLPEQPADNVEKEKETCIEDDHPTAAASESPLKPLRLKKRTECGSRPSWKRALWTDEAARSRSD